MSDEKGIYWLASYPKSGNTWFRVFLAHALRDKEDAFDLNAIRTGAIASARGWVDDALGFDTADLSHDEQEPLRRQAYIWLASQMKKPEHHKIHDAYTYLDNGLPMIPSEGSLGALYFVRNPLDVAISFANHMNSTIDKAIELMAKPDNTFCGGHKKQANQLRQWLLSWSAHVESWAHAKHMNCLVIRYEDMKQKPLETFTKAANFLKLGVDEDKIKWAIEQSDIGKLQKLEAEGGFSEKPANTEHFFRKGIVGDWKKKLTQDQIDRVIQAHGTVMEAYGYL